MMVPAWLLLAALGQEKFALAPENPDSPIRLVVTVPEPIVQGKVFLDLKCTDGSSPEAESPGLIRSAGWALAREGGQYALSPTGNPRSEVPGISWRWRHRGTESWHEDLWDNLAAQVSWNPTGPAPQKRPRWPWVAAEAISAAILMAGLFLWIRSRHPAQRLFAAMRSAGEGEAAWASLHQFISEYLANHWNLSGRNLVLAWHMKRLDPHLGRRLEQLTETTLAARHGTGTDDPQPLFAAWGLWLRDAEKYRLRRF